MEVKDLKLGMVVCHQNYVGTVTEIDGNWVTLNYNYVCRVEYCEIYKCGENEENEIFTAIRNELGINNIWGKIIRFDWFILFLKTLGYEYKGNDDKNESHLFYNSRKGFTLSVHPVCYYPKQGELFRICSMGVF